MGKGVGVVAGKAAAPPRPVAPASIGVPEPRIVPAADVGLSILARGVSGSGKTRGA